MRKLTKIIFVGLVTDKNTIFSYNTRLLCSRLPCCGGNSEKCINQKNEIKIGGIKS